MRSRKFCEGCEFYYGCCTFGKPCPFPRNVREPSPRAIALKRLNMSLTERWGNTIKLGTVFKGLDLPTEKLEAISKLEIEIMELIEEEIKEEEDR